MDGKRNLICYHYFRRKVEKKVNCLSFVKIVTFIAVAAVLGCCLFACSPYSKEKKILQIDINEISTKFKRLYKFGCFCPESDLFWEEKASLNQARSALGAAASNGRIYAIGGSSIDKIGLSTVEEYDPATDTWAFKSPMPTPRGGLAVVAAGNGKIHALGGTNPSGTDSIGTVEEYDPITDAWTTKESMPVKTFLPGATCANDGKIYIIGGFDVRTQKSLATVQRYEVSTGTWEVLESMPTDRHCLAAVAATNGKIYAIGGINKDGVALSVVEEYDPVSDSWEERAPMPTNRQCLAAAAASNGKIYAIAGLYGPGLAIVEEYDPGMNRWELKSPIRTGRWLMGVACHDNKIYVIGGYSREGGSVILLDSVEEGTICPWGS